MQADTQAQLAFFLTGRCQSGHLDAIEGLGLRPALFAGYRELTQLRYDFPLVLVDGRADREFAQSLSSIIDAALARVATGSEGERIRKHALRLERQIRTLVAGGTAGSLAELWDQAASQGANRADSLFQDSMRRTRSAVEVDGAVVDCDARLPARLLQQAWAALQAHKAARLRQVLDRLVLKLSDILKADFERSDDGRSATHLQAAVGTGFAGAFDFDAMSRLLCQALPAPVFPERRRQRLRGLLDTLRAQEFIAAPAVPAGGAGAAKPYSFVFPSCAGALAAYRERQPKLIELAKAIAMAGLEIEGQYSEARHDALFEQFGADGLDPQELARFPDYLVCVNADEMQALEQAHLMEALASGLPIKILLQIDDLLEAPAHGAGSLSAGLRSRQLTQMAIGLNDVFVLQSSSSNLLRFRAGVLHGLRYSGAALFSVFSGAGAQASDLPPYLMAAAAMESRAFPAFSYDPSAGPDWASRFYLEANSQVELDWPVQPLAYADEQHQRVSQELAFTLVDFLAGDRRYARHFARVPRSPGHDGTIPVAESLAQERQDAPDRVPSLLMVDADNGLHQVIVDERLLQQARRCRDLWHSLQELAGVHNSHAQRLLARAKQSWEERLQRADAAGAPVAPTAQPESSAPAAVSAALAPEPPPEPERSPDQAYIETPRCSSCDECTQINNKMFSYDSNKQAYIADITAGTYAQLVAAAQSCQVAIIHPGQPCNPNEPGLDELRQQAAEFL